MKSQFNCPILGAGYYNENLLRDSNIWRIEKTTWNYYDAHHRTCEEITPEQAYLMLKYNRLRIPPLQPRASGG